MKSPFQTFSFVFPQRRLPLHAMIGGCGLQRADSGYNWDGLMRGKSEFSLFQYTLAGKGMLEYEGRPMEAHAGSAMLLHFPHRHRYWWPKGNASWNFIYLTLHGREIRRLWAPMEAARGPLVAMERGSPPVLLARQIIAMARVEKITTEFEMSSLAYEFMMSLCREVIGDGAPAPLPDEFADVKEFCRKHFHENIGLDDMAGRARLSRSHFARQFKAALGISPGAYLFDLRMREALRLLRDSELILKTVAERCGFSEVNYFCRAFRKFSGGSPGSFRRSGMY